MKEYEQYLKYTGTTTLSSMSKADLINLVERGESSFLEFKQKVASPEKLAREIAAFANSEGGIILVGVGDKGELIGLETYLEEEFWLKQAAEQECQWPGIGSMFIRSVRASDYPLVMTISLMYVFVVLTASLVIDVLTALIDPRVRLGKE